MPPSQIDPATLAGFGNSPSATYHRQPTQSSGRRFLVFIRSGAAPVRQPRWLLDPAQRHYDILGSFFATPEPGCWLLEHADYVASGGLSKFHAAKLLLAPEILERYAGVLFLDDDVETHFDPGVFGDFVLQQGLALAQPSLTLDSYFSHLICLHHPSCVWRETNFVEVMAPFFATDLLRVAIAEFDRSISTWGLDVLWGVRYASSHRIAVVDCFSMRHTRPNDSHGGPFYRYLQGMGVDAAAELDGILADHGLQRFEFATRRVVFRTAAIEPPRRNPAA